MKNQLKFIFDQFNHNSEYISYKALNSGHINDTYLIKTKQKPYFILQRINHKVFKDVPGLIANKIAVSQHLRKKMSHLPEKELRRRVLSFLTTKKGNLYYKGEEGNFWNLMIYINNNKTIEVVNSEEIAYEGGKLFGNFLNLTDDFAPSQLVEVIPKFHDMSYRYYQYALSIQSAPKERLARVGAYVKLIDALKEEMHLLQRLKESGKIPIRVTHNDTKISNALFDLNNKGLCVIDTDTVMPGIVHYDFGDAIRTICNTASEDEKDLSLVNFNMTYYRAYEKGFLEEMRESLCPVELKYLPLAAKTMIFIMALRFLTDFLNCDIFYKTAYPEHNLDRAKNQFKLLESFSKNFKKVDI